MPSIIKFAAVSALIYFGYKACAGSDACAPPITRGSSSSAQHNAVDPAEEASMDSFPASDAPARNTFT